MTKPFSAFPKIALLIVFACSAMPVFAQHGGGGGHMGGGGGGGFHGGGGGGFHGGGGGGAMHSGGGVPHSGGGTVRGGYSAPPAAGYGAPRASAPSPMRPGPGYASRPGPTSSYVRPGNNFPRENARTGTASAPAAGNDGRWHSFGSAPQNHSASAAPAEPGSANTGSANNGNGGWHVPSGSRSTGPTGATRSFSGERGEVWENSPASRNVVSRSQSLSAIHNSVTSSLAAKAAFRASPTPSASSRFNNSSSLSIKRGFTAGTATNTTSIQQLRSGFNRFGRRFGGWGGGCWNCGFGFGGLGWGWGSPWGWGGFGWGWGFGYWGWNPFWADPWWGWGWSTPAYGYPTNNYYIYNNDSGSGYAAPAPEDNSQPAPEDNNSSDQNNQSLNGDWVTPNGPSPSASPSAGTLAVPVLIYMKNGAVFSVRDYWMSDSEFHYVLMNGEQKAVDLELVDLGRTNSENARSGVKFIFKSEPSAPPPDEHFGPPAKPDSGQPTLGPKPEART